MSKIFFDKENKSQKGENKKEKVAIIFQKSPLKYHRKLKNQGECF